MLVYREKANLANYVFTCRYDQDRFTLWKATAGGCLCLKNKAYLITVSFADASGTVRDAPIRMAQSDISMKDVLDNKDSELEYNIQEWPGSDSDERRSMNLTSGARLTRKSLPFDFNYENSMNIPGIPSLSTLNVLPSTRFSFPTKTIEFGSEFGRCITEKGSFNNSGSFKGEEGSPNRFRGEFTLPQDQSLFYSGFLPHRTTQYEMDQSDHIDTLSATLKAY